MAPPTGPFSVLVPSGHGIDCHTDVDYTDLSSCYSDGFNSFDKSKTYSNNDNICYGTGEVDDQDTRIGGYCTLAALADCSVVWGIADSAVALLMSFRGSSCTISCKARRRRAARRHHLDYLVRSQR